MAMRRGTARFPWDLVPRKQRMKLDYHRCWTAPFLSGRSLTVARYMILKLFISICYRLYSMYLGCLFCLFVYVEFFRIFLQ